MSEAKRPATPPPPPPWRGMLGIGVYFLRVVPLASSGQRSRSLGLSEGGLGLRMWSASAQDTDLPTGFLKIQAHFLFFKYRNKV